MKILITAPSLDPNKNVSGVSAVVQSIIEYNKLHQYFHYLLGRPDKPMMKVIWLYTILMQLLKFPFYLKKNNIEIVHQNLPFDPKGVVREFIINMWCKVLGVPVVLHLHGGVFLMNGISNVFYEQLAKSILQNSKKILVLSDIEEQALKQNFKFVETVVLRNSIDIKHFIPKKEKRESNIKTILFLGRIHESKGVYDLLQAFKILKNKILFKFILCGEGSLRKYLAEECSTLLGDDFEYKGIVSGNEKLNIIQNADIFLLPSRYGEGLPIALLETMAVGLVPVVTDDASMKYIVQPFENGIRVQKENPEDLSQKLLLLLNDNELIKRLSENAVATIRNNYSIDNYIIELNNIYTSLIYFK